MKILFLCGSSEPDSLNQALLNKAQEMLPDIEPLTVDITDLPFYRKALDGDNRPANVQALLDAITAADALIIASPEFNHSVPAVLKNALDWASRPAFASPLTGKPVTCFSASPSTAGGNIGLTHLKQVLDTCLCDVYPSINYCLGGAHEKIINGELKDSDALRRMEHHLQGFREWIAA